MRYIYQSEVQDGRGNFVAGATVTVTEAGGSTKASIYSAFTGGTVDADGIITTGTDGTFAFYVDEDDYAHNQQFRIVWSKSGFTSETWDYIQIFPNPNVAVVVLPESFGAVGDGTTDDSTAIQDAIDSISSGVVKFASKTYAIGTGLTFAEHIEYIGDGPNATTIKALAAVNMVTIANNQYHYKIKGILFDGDDTATAGLVLGDASAQSGFAHIDRVEIKDIDGTAVDAGWFFNTDFTQMYVHGCTVGIDINKGQHNHIDGWFYDNGTHITATALQDSDIDIVSYNTTSNVRAIRLTGASHYNSITGAFEPQDDHTGGDVILIDGESQGNRIVGASFYANTDSNADADDLNYITIGDATDGGPSIGNVIRDNKFLGLHDSSYYHVNLLYALRTVIQDNVTSETGSVVLINEPVNEKAAWTKYIPISTEGNITTVASANLSLTSQHIGKMIHVTTGAGNRTITLPMCEYSTGGIITIYKDDAGAGEVIVSREAGTETFVPGGAQTRNVASQYDYVVVQSDGTNWIILDARVA